MGSRVRGNDVLRLPVDWRVTNGIKLLAIVTTLGPATLANVYYGRSPPSAYVRWSTSAAKMP